MGKEIVNSIGSFNSFMKYWVTSVVAYISLIFDFKYIVSYLSLSLSSSSITTESGDVIKNRIIIKIKE